MLVKKHRQRCFPAAWAVALMLCSLAVLAVQGCKKKEPFDFTGIAGIYSVRITETSYPQTTVADIYGASISQDGKLTLEVSYLFFESYELEMNSNELGAQAADLVSTGTTGADGIPIEVPVEDKVTLLLDENLKLTAIVWERSVDDTQYNDLGGRIRYEIQKADDTGTQTKFSWQPRLESAGPAGFSPQAANLGIDHAQLLSLAHDDNSERFYRLWREEENLYTGQVTTPILYLCASMELPEGYTRRSIDVILKNEKLGSLTTVFDTVEEAFYSDSDPLIRLYYPAD